MNFRTYILSIVILPVILGCNGTADGGTLFKIVPPSESGLDFENTITETEDFSVLKYNNMYMGGGVAVGDIDNDGLADVFLTSNQQSNKLYLNQGRLKFEDITEAAKIPGDTGMKSWATGVSMVDINHDGWLDIYVCMVNIHRGLQGTNKLYINNKDNTFTESAAAYGLDIGTYSHQAAFFDYDLDGDLDMYLLNQAVHTPNAYRPGDIRKIRDSLSGDRLYKNDNGQFIDVSEAAGIYGGANGYGLALNVSDFNNDGYPDIYVSNDFHENDYLYYNQKNGTFKENITESMGHTSTFSMGNDVADINNDGWQDLITLDMKPKDERILKTMLGVESYNIYRFKINHSYHFQYPRNMLQINRGTLFDTQSAQFSELGENYGISATDWSWGALFADFDLDGNKDLYITNGIPHRPNDLDYINYVSNEQEKRKDLDFQTKIDAIPEGQLNNYAFQNTGKGFTDVSEVWGLDLYGSSNGAAYADLDNDGDLDLVVNNLNAPATLYRNTSEEGDTDKNYLKVRCKGADLNPFGIGCRVSLSSGGVRQMMELYPTKGWVSSTEPTLLFGVDASKSIDTLTVVWPDGKTQMLKDIQANQTLTLDHGAAEKRKTDNIIPSEKMFRNITENSGIDFIHKENGYIDFEFEKLMPRMISSEGPKVAVADVNNDGLDDFYIGGAKNQAGELYIQQRDTTAIFQKQKADAFFRDRASEDTGSVFLDVDSDGDLDLYVVSGGGEPFDDMTMFDRLYINDGSGSYTKSDNHPMLDFNGSCAIAADFNEDGFTDIFVGARSIPGAYGTFMRSRILLGTGKGPLYDYTARIFGENINLGMVTDAAWLPASKELIVVGEWMPVTVLDFKNIPLIEKKMEFTNGWWNDIYASDIDGDGDQDLLLGNFGINSNLKASKERPVNLYLKDFDGNGAIDPILGFYSNDIEYPFYGLDEMAKQLVSLKKKYTTYKSFADSDLHEVFPDSTLKGAGRLQAFEFKSVYYENRGQGNFKPSSLPPDLQLSSLYGFAAEDFNKDGAREVLAGGNFSSNQINIGKNDASYGHLMEIDANDSVLSTIDPLQSGFAVSGEVRDIHILESGDAGKLILVSRNNEKPQLFKYNREAQ